MTAWPIVALSEVADLNPRLRANLDDDAVVSFLGMANVAEDGTTTKGDERTYREVKKGFTPFKSGDILLAKITPCFQNGKIVQAKVTHPHGFGSTEFHVIRSKGDQFDHRYGLHYLRQQHIRVDGERRMTGSGGQRRVPADFLKALPLVLPPLPEQRRIAAILDHVDALRARRRAALAQLEELTQAVFVDMFGEPVSNDRAWESGTIGSYIDGFDSGRNLVGNDDDNGGYRVLKVSAVTSLTFKNAESKPLPSGYVPPVAHLVKAGDLLFSRANTAELVGATAFVSHTDGRTALPDKLWRFRWKAKSLAAPRYVEKLFQRPQFRQLISDRATGSSGSMKNISRDKVLTINLGWPPFSMQNEFSERIEQIDLIADRHRTALAELDSLFVSLQSRAFRGEL